MSYRKAVVGGALSLLILLISATSAFASNGTGGGGFGGGGGTHRDSGSARFVRWVLIDGRPEPTRPGTPQRIKNVIIAATRIAYLPYLYGGGHSYYTQVGGWRGFTRVNHSGYDCSGSVSFALHANGHRGNFMREPLDSVQFETWAKPGKGKWFTVYTNWEHAYLVIAGLRFDTVAAQFNSNHSRWSSNVAAGASDTASAFVARHIAGW